MLRVINFRSLERSRLTLGVILVGEVTAIGRARSVNAPESTAVLALAESGQINMANETTVLKRLSEVLLVDVVVEESSDENREVIMAVYKEGQSALLIVSYSMRRVVAPINGV